MPIGPEACIGCRWRKPSEGVGAKLAEFDRCKHPQTTWKYCEEERAGPAGWRSMWFRKCGREGRLYEQGAES